MEKLITFGVVVLSALYLQAFDTFRDAFADGQEKLKAKNWVEAIKSFEQAAKKGNDSEKANAFYYIGESYRNNGQREEAIAAYTAGVALTKAPADIRALMQNRIGACYLELNKYDESIAEYKKTYAISNAASGYLHGARIGLAYVLCNQKEYAEAIKYYREVVAGTNVHVPFLNEAQFTIGQCYYNLGDLAKAKEEFNKVLLLKQVDAAYKKKTEEMLAQIASEE